MMEMTKPRRRMFAALKERGTYTVKSREHPAANALIRAGLAYRSTSTAKAFVIHPTGKDVADARTA